MKAVLYEPCANCPFRSDRPAFLTRGRAEAIMDDLRHDQHFNCHKTLDYSDGEGAHTDKTAICAGFAIIAEGLKHPTQMMRIAERIGIYDHRKLNMKAPVHKTPKAFIKAQK
jgi:hypothetical protein